MASRRHDKRMLRRRAESRLLPGERFHVSELTMNKVEALVHELQVHQIELEIQNEELTAAHDELEELNARYRDLYDAAPVGYVTLDTRGVITEANVTAAIMLGRPRARVIGVTLYQFVARVDEEVYFEHRRRAQSSIHGDRCELRLVNAQDQPIDVLLQSVPVRDDTGAVIALRSVATDISARKTAEGAWRQADAIIRAADQGVLVMNRNGRITRVNPAFSSLSGFPEAEVEGRPIEELFQHDESDTGRLDLLETLAQHGTWRGELFVRCRNGETFPAAVSLVEVLDEHGNLSSYAGLLSDITERKRSESALVWRANYDALTGLANRALFLDRLHVAAEEAHRHGHLVGLLFIDLDRFKEINDQFGHAAGDTLLDAVAKRLTGQVRGHDTVARLGGDEFAVILTDIHQIQHIASITEKLIEQLSMPLLFAGHEIPCSISVGIAVLPVDAEDSETLSNYADLALYRAKAQRGGAYAFFKESMTRQAQEHANLQQELARAIRRNEFRVYYQPIVDAKSGALVGAEALLRWAHPERGVLLPEPFLAVAEDTGQIMPLGAWVIETGTRQWAEWCEDGDPANWPFLCINVSPRQLRYPSAFRKTAEQLQTTPLPTNRICLEITEGMAMNSAGKAREHLRALKDLGLNLAMDDFGKGYSALGYLKDLPFDILKIDRSFIHEIESSEDAAHLVSAIVQMAHGLRLKVVAEGVETPGQLAFIRQSGCDYVQGFLIARPLTPARMKQVCRQGLPRFMPD